MSVLEKISSARGTFKQGANRRLAEEIAAAKDSEAIIELVQNLGHKKKVVQGYCIKVLFEIGEIEPELIAGYAKEFIGLLSSTNNRMQWGGMSALNHVTPYNRQLGVVADF